MFQSVAPRPGKIAFQVEPFPIPNFQVLPEASKVTALPVAEPVAIFQEIEEQVEEVLEITSAAKDTPFLVATEVEDEIFASEEAPSDISQPLVSVAENVAVEHTEFFEEVEAFEENAQEEIEVVEMIEMVEAVETEAAPSNLHNPFADIVAAVVEDSVIDAAPEFEAQPAAEVPLAAQSSAVMSWQPPAPRKKKSPKLGGFFRQ